MMVCGSITYCTKMKMQNLIFLAVVLNEPHNCSNARQQASAVNSLESKKVEVCLWWWIAEAMQPAIYGCVGKCVGWGQKKMIWSIFAFCVEMKLYI